MNYENKLIWVSCSMIGDDVQPLTHLGEAAFAVRAARVGQRGRATKAQLSSFINFKALIEPQQVKLLILLQNTLNTFCFTYCSSIASFVPYNNPAIPKYPTMEAVKDTINTALEKLHITGGANQGTPAQQPSEEQFNQLKSKYEKAGQEQVFVCQVAEELNLEHFTELCKCRKSI